MDALIFPERRKNPIKAIQITTKISAAFDVLSTHKFIITALSRGRFDNTQLLTYAINGGWHFNNLAQDFAK